MNKFKTIPAEIQHDQKRVPYTISVIGTKKDLVNWRVDRKRIDAEYALGAAERFAKRMENSIQMVEDQLVRDKKISESEKVETSHIDYREGKYRNSLQVIAVKIPEEPKKPVLTKVREACTKWALAILRNANFNND